MCSCSCLCLRALSAKICGRHRHFAAMTDRYFQNNFPDFDSPEDENVRTYRIRDLDPSSPSLKQLFHDALSLKDKVIQATWSKKAAAVHDPIMYTGVLGTAFLCFKAYQVAGNADDLDLCADIVDRCAVAGMSMKQYITFICGQPGIYALGAAAAKCKGDKQRLDHYLHLFYKVANESALAAGPSEGGLGMPYELLYGRAGFLWAALFINKYVGDETIPWMTLGPIVDAMLTAGRASGSRSSCPLMYQWHGKRYWGAAHGLAGIMHVLMDFPLANDDAEAVKGTLCYMIRNCFHSGNYPSSEGNQKDELVHWCHGAPGISMTLCKAAERFPEVPAFKEAALASGDVVWKRGLLRRLGLCHGISGNAYTFLTLYRLTDDKHHLYRAMCFSGFLHDHAFNFISSGQMHGGDHPYSLFEGLAGTACLWLDMMRPDLARFPAYEL